MQYQPAGGPHQVQPSALALVVDTPASTSRRQRYAELRAGAPVVVPSLLLCDFARLGDEVRALEAAGAKALHLDVMDGVFVPNITYGLPIVEAVRSVTELPIETHLMIADPAQYAEQFFRAGADAITFHIEALPEPRPLLEKLRSIGAIAGLAYNPETPLEAVFGLLDACDLVLTMSVNPGFGGQSFQEVAFEKLRRLRELARPDLILEVDGGVNERTIGAVAEAGAQLFVAGSAVFGKPDYGPAIAQLTRLASAPSRT
jgi:ribulose-phosphate 3-epimerase